jgi:outer membrane biosynthesis protein TonB
MYHTKHKKHNSRFKSVPGTFDNPAIEKKSRFRAHDQDVSAIKSDADQIKYLKISALDTAKTSREWAGTAPIFECMAGTVYRTDTRYLPTELSPNEKSFAAYNQETLFLKYRLNESGVKKHFSSEAQDNPKFTELVFVDTMPGMFQRLSCLKQSRVQVAARGGIETPFLPFKAYAYYGPENGDFMDRARTNLRLMQAEIINGKRPVGHGDITVEITSEFPQKIHVLVVHMYDSEGFTIKKAKKSIKRTGADVDLVYFVSTHSKKAEEEIQKLHYYSCGLISKTSTSKADNQNTYIVGLIKAKELVESPIVFDTEQSTRTQKAFQKLQDGIPMKRAQKPQQTWSDESTTTNEPALEEKQREEQQEDEQQHEEQQEDEQQQEEQQEDEQQHEEQQEDEQQHEEQQQEEQQQEEQRDDISIKGGAPVSESQSQRQTLSAIRGRYSRPRDDNSFSFLSERALIKQRSRAHREQLRRRRNSQEPSAPKQ